jgi:hypothetical protein
MASINKFLSKINQASTALKSVKGISSKIFGTGYQTNVSTQEQDVETERRRLQQNAKALKGASNPLQFQGTKYASQPIVPSSQELVYPRENPVDNYIHFTILPRSQRSGGNLLSTGKTEIYLYAPNVKNDAPSISYNNVDFGNVQRDILNNGFFDMDGGVRAEISEILAKTLNKIYLGTRDFEQNRTVNPQQEVMFEGIQFRSFDMAFQFRPNSINESEEINNIIWAFKTAMLPDTYQLKDNQVAADISENYFNLPNIIEIEWFGKIKDRIDGFQKSFITNVSVQYNGGNKMETFKDGMPLVIDMSISFVENVLMTQENYQRITASSKKDLTNIDEPPSARDLISDNQTKEVERKQEKSTYPATDWTKTKILPPGGLKEDFLDSFGAGPTKMPWED